MEENIKPLQDKKKYRHRPEPLFIPPPSFNFPASYSGATLYQSQLRSPRILGDHLLDRAHELPPYTPPPMLSPVRQGSGLFSSVITSSHGASHPQLPLTPLTPTPRVFLCRSSKYFIYYSIFSEPKLAGCIKCYYNVSFVWFFLWDNQPGKISCTCLYAYVHPLTHLLHAHACTHVLFFQFSKVYLFQSAICLVWRSYRCDSDIKRTG